MSSERDSRAIRPASGDSIRPLESLARERVDQYNRMVETVVLRAEVDIYTARYAISARTLELSSSPNGEAIFKNTMKVVRQKSEKEQGEFMKALEISRELMPGDLENKLRF